MPHFKRFSPARLLVVVATAALLAGCAPPRPVNGYSDGATAGSAGAGATLLQGECSNAANCNKNKI